MKKSVSSYIVDNGARLSKIYDLAEEYAMEYLHEPELTYLARRRNKIMDDIAEMATEILILRQKLYEAQLGNIIAPLVYNKSYAYKQGWHDAIEKALKEAYTIHHYGDIFRVVQEETLIGVGMAYEQVNTDKIGHWILKRTFPTKLYDEYLNEYKCSECHRLIRCTKSQLDNYPYCHCGAKMAESEVKE